MGWAVDRVLIATFPPAARIVGGWAPLALPLACASALAGLSLLPSVAGVRALERSVWAATAWLFAWQLWLAVAARRGHLLRLELAVRKQHYLQACAQGSILLYWGWYWPTVYDWVYLLVAQLLFAYAFDALLAWSRGEVYRLGFGPFPVVFSINLFLVFKPEWFYLQFLMVAVAFTAKALIRWTKDGRRVHVFNPSAFALGLFSLGLLATRSTSITWGHEIANTLMYAPHIYAFIFLVGLPGQFLFGVTTMTMPAVVTTYVFGLVYFLVTGTYFFFDSYIPIAVFLGMHLLFTDPSTSPKTELGRVIFGITYALSVVVLYDVLGRLGAPTFYDKLLAVPIMNLMVKIIDRVAASTAVTRFAPAGPAASVGGRMRNLAYVGVWIVVFTLMSAVQAVGDHHPGHWIPFWEKACAENRGGACRNLAVLLAGHCRDGSGWACNEYAILVQPDRRPDNARRLFQRACDLGFQTGCSNLGPQPSEPVHRTLPTLVDYPIILREGKGPLPSLGASQLRQRACSQGYVEECT
jgi:hypothetical protein